MPNNKWNYGKKQVVWTASPLPKPAIMSSTSPACTAQVLFPGLPVWLRRVLRRLIDDFYLLYYFFTFRISPTCAWFISFKGHLQTTACQGDDAKGGSTWSASGGLVMLVAMADAFFGRLVESVHVFWSVEMMASSRVNNPCYRRYFRKQPIPTASCRPPKQECCKSLLCYVPSMLSN